MSGFEMTLRIHAETLSSNISRILEEKIEKGMLSDDVKYKAAELYAKKIRPYVPMEKKTLRNSTDIVPYNGVYAVEYHPVDKYGHEYAEFQYYADDSTWDRHTPGTYSHWNQHLTRLEREDYYREFADEISSAMNGV